ncbi:MAG: O-antigen ligase family protein, partial [Chloroflexi bacterium]|nr:O-antigen ligase family protein [Chloroflexota bacterium]
MAIRRVLTAPGRLASQVGVSIGLLICLGVIAPIVVVEPLQDSLVLPKLATTVTVTGAATIWAAALLLRDRWPAGRWPMTLWVSAAAFALINVLAFAFAFDWRQSLFGEQLRYQGLATTLTYVMLFAVTALAVRSTRDVRWLLFGLFLGAVGVSIYALLQKADMDWFEGMWSARAQERPAGTLGQPNAFAAYLVAVISTSTFLVLTAGQRWHQAVLGAGVVVMLFALMFTVSRSGYIAMFVVLVVWSAGALVWYSSYRLGLPPTRRQLLGAGAGGLAAALLLVSIAAAVFVGLPQGRAILGDAAERAGGVNDFDSQAVGGRLSLWWMAARMTADEPLLGHGQDSFSIRFAEYRDRPDIRGIGIEGIQPESSHNFFLDLAAGTGLLGLLSFLALAGAVFWHAGRRALTTTDASLRVAFVCLGTGILAYLVAVFFGFSEAMTTWLLWLLLGAAAGLAARADDEGENGGPATVLERAERAPLREIERPTTLAVGMAAVVLIVIGAGMLAWAATFVAADLASAQSGRASLAGDSQAAVDLAVRAVTLNPLERGYLNQHADAEGFAAREPGEREAALRNELNVQEKLLRRFQPGSSEVLGFALTLSAAGVFGLGQLGRELFPRVDAGQFTMLVRAPVGTRLERTEEWIAQVEEALQEAIGKPDPEDLDPDSDLALLISNIGVLYDWPAAYTPNDGPMDAFILVQLKQNREHTSQEWVRELRASLGEQFPELQFSFDTGGMLTAALNMGLPAP